LDKIFVHDGHVKWYLHSPLRGRYSHDYTFVWVMRELALTLILWLAYWHVWAIDFIQTARNIGIFVLIVN